MFDLVRVPEADEIADVPTDPIEGLNGRGGEIHEDVLIVPAEGVLPVGGDVLLGSVRRERPQQGGEPRALAVAAELGQGPPTIPEDLGEIGLEAVLGGQGVGLVGGPVNGIVVAVGPEPSIRELRLYKSFEMFEGTPQTLCMMTFSRIASCSRAVCAITWNTQMKADRSSETPRGKGFALEKPWHSEPPVMRGCLMEGRSPMICLMAAMVVREREHGADLAAGIPFLREREVPGGRGRPSPKDASRGGDNFAHEHLDPGGGARGNDEEVEGVPAPPIPVKRSRMRTNAGPRG